MLFKLVLFFGFFFQTTNKYMPYPSSGLLFILSSFPLLFEIMDALMSSYREERRKYVVTVNLLSHVNN